ncbi:hypothetical protein OBBRIDRAFT_821286 [Obba rivulosa]|uniref:Methyltransferase domain-containing protein n=1 Tax=Obba rivulosa TaxID=1052685 RepID=A0A8E2ASP0_9APHY|nr:hypothetical protein OBBRIDRAFT_821286 [Obba rivulosa]
MASSLSYLHPSTQYLSMTMMMSVHLEHRILVPEEKLTPKPILRLDPSLLNLSQKTRIFLCDEVTQDNAELRRRIFDVQNEAYEKHPSPYIYAFKFLATTMSETPIYPTVLEAGVSGDTLLLDLGCCMGTDVRKLVYDGYPASNILACDTRQDFIDLGYKLFGDANTCPVHFFTSDIFEVPVQFDEVPPGLLTSEVADLEELTDSLTHIYAGALFDLFDQPMQKSLALRLLTLLRRKKGSIIFGVQRGLSEEGYVDGLSRDRNAHSPKSWASMWKEAFAEAEGEEFADTRVFTEATLSGASDLGMYKGQMLHWSVRIM